MRDRVDTDLDAKRQQLELVCLAPYTPLELLPVVVWLQRPTSVWLCFSFQPRG
jgi:hypothetical protein